MNLLNKSIAHSGARDHNADDKNYGDGVSASIRSNALISQSMQSMSSKNIPRHADRQSLKSASIASCSSASRFAQLRSKQKRNAMLRMAQSATMSKLDEQSQVRSQASAAELESRAGAEDVDRDV